MALAAKQTPRLSLYSAALSCFVRAGLFGGRARGRSRESRGRNETISKLNPYEIMVILDPELSEEEQAEIIDRAKELVEKGGGVWLGHEPWGRRTLAYEINKRTEGFYHLLYFDADPGTLSELTRVLRITEGAMRHMAVRRRSDQALPGSSSAREAAGTTAG